MNDFVIDAKWSSASHGELKIRETSGSLRIAVGDEVATRVADVWSGSFNDATPVSVYPLALWFAANWWRLRWEAAPVAPYPPSDWLQAHDTASVGYGFIWPRMRFVPEGAAISVISRSSRQTDVEPFWYLNNFEQSISPETFEECLAGFIELVIARLHARSLQNTELEKLWREVENERRDDFAALYRRYEAQLGYDPDDGPEAGITKMCKRSSEAGIEAMSEIAVACWGDKAETRFNDVLVMAAARGVESCIPDELVAPKLSCGAAHFDSAPWQLGWKLAKELRKKLPISSGPLKNRILSDILSLPETALQPSSAEGEDHYLGLAVRNGDSKKLRIHFKKQKGNFIRTSRRFEAVRFIADFVIAGEKDKWLPATSAKTVRQKMQRAFAAEFLCPIEELVAFVEDDYSEDKLTEAGEYFGVSPRTIESHLVNTHTISHDEAPTLSSV